MQSITFQCQCGRQLMAPVEDVGKSCRCPDCGATLAVPSPQQEILHAVHAEGKQEQEATYLTRYHVCQKGRRAGGQRYCSIPLFHLTSLTYQYTAPIGCLVIAVLALLATIGAGVLAARERGHDQEMLMAVAAIAFFLFVVFLVGYFLGRSQGLVISSPSEKIVVSISGSNKQVLLDFARLIERQQVRVLGGKSNAPLAHVCHLLT